MNQILAISPYWADDLGTWVFDDENAKLDREPFVSGVPEMIDVLVDQIPNAKSGFRLLFSSQPFPEFQEKLKWEKEEYDGNWYSLEGSEMNGWLCPAMFKYFKEAPEEIYVKAEEINTGHHSSNH